MSDTGLMAEVKVGGDLSDHKGVALPGQQAVHRERHSQGRGRISPSAERSVSTYVAASFVRSGDDVRRVAELAGDTPVIAKIELAQAYENLDDILEPSFGVMVARGDLGVQLPLERIPLIQAEILRRTNAAGPDLDHRHRDVGVDDQEPAADPCRGHRCRDCGHRRHRCGDVVRGDRRRRLPGPDGRRHGRDLSCGRRGHVVQSRRPPCPVRRGWQHGGLSGGSGRHRGGDQPRGQGNRRLHRVRQHRPADLQVPARRSDRRLQPK